MALIARTRPQAVQELAARNDELEARLRALEESRRAEATSQIAR